MAWRPLPLLVGFVALVAGCATKDSGDGSPKVPVFIQTAGDEPATIQVWVETTTGTRLYDTSGTVDGGQTKQVGAFSVGAGNYTVRALWEGSPAHDDLIVRPGSPASRQVEKVLAAITSDAFRVDVWYTYVE